jgi:hypothetical protein
LPPRLAVFPKILLFAFDHMTSKVLIASPYDIDDTLASKFPSALKIVSSPAYFPLEDEKLIFFPFG